MAEPVYDPDWDEYLVEERRAAARYPSNRNASCHPPTAGADSTFVKIRDVSASGVGLLTNRRFAPGTVLVLDVNAGTPDQVSVLTRVVRLVAQPDGRWLVGCTLFGEMSREDFAAFRTEQARAGAEERQAGVRAPEGLVAVCRSASPGALGQWAAEVSDLTQTGMRLLIHREFAEDAYLKVTLPPRGLQKAHTVIVRVVRRERRPDRRWLLGCEICTHVPRRVVPAKRPGAAKDGKAEAQAETTGAQDSAGRPQ